MSTSAIVLIAIAILAVIIIAAFIKIYNELAKDGDSADRPQVSSIVPEDLPPPCDNSDTAVTPPPPGVTEGAYLSGPCLVVP